MPQIISYFLFSAIAGNIIPAIATANAMIAGLVVLHAFRVLNQEYEKCPSIYLRKKSIHSKFILAADKQISKANPSCYVCSPKPFVNVFVNVNTMTVKEFENELLKKHLNMVAPDAVLDGKGVVVISSEEGETQVFKSVQLCSRKWWYIQIKNVFRQMMKRSLPNLALSMEVS